METRVHFQVLKPETSTAPGRWDGQSFRFLYFEMIPLKK